MSCEYRLSFGGCPPTARHSNKNKADRPGHMRTRTSYIALRTAQDPNPVQQTEIGARHSPRVQQPEQRTHRGQQRYHQTRTKTAPSAVRLHAFPRHLSTHPHSPYSPYTHRTPPTHLPHPPNPPVHLIEHEIVSPTEHDGAGGVRLGSLEEDQLTVADTLLGNLEWHRNGGGGGGVGSGGITGRGRAAKTSSGGSRAKGGAWPRQANKKGTMPASLGYNTQQHGLLGSRR